MDNEPSFSIYEAAKQIGRTSQWVRIMVYEDRFPGARKDGRGKWQIPRSAIEEFKQRQAVSA
jgi:Helix-turn-helix domain